jgi:hypothetical protein
MAFRFHLFPVGNGTKFTIKLPSNPNEANKELEKENDRIEDSIICG